MRQFSRLSGKEAKEAMSVQLERLKAATGSEERRARELHRRKQVQLQQAKAVVADEHYQLCLKWRLGLRPWLLLWRRNKHLVAVVRSRRYAPFMNIWPALHTARSAD